MELRNYTDMLERGEAFVRAKADTVDTAGLSVHIKFTRARGRDINGYYRWADRRMVLAVKRRLKYPRLAGYGVGTTPRIGKRRPGQPPYKLVWHDDRFESPDDLLVFVAGHEFWHFLCHTGQRKRDHETKANCNGFLWLHEFQAWTGGAVERIPQLPPRPDLRAIAAAAADNGATAPAREPDWERRVAAFSPSGQESGRQLPLFR